MVTEYTRQHPEISLEIWCGWSAEILGRLRADELDLAFALVDGERAHYLSRCWIERPTWAAAQGVDYDPSKSIPLAAHPEGCAYRARMREALDAEQMRRSEEHTSELQSLLRSSYAVVCLKQTTTPYKINTTEH